MGRVAIFADHPRRPGLIHIRAAAIASHVDGRRRRSLLGNSRLAHAFENPLELGQVRQVVAHRGPGGAGAGDGEGRVEREAGLDGGTRLVNSTKLREGGGQLKICSG